MSKNITFSTDSRQKIKTGVDTIANVVKVTLGPKGRNVIIEDSFGNPHITKDGVTVAKAVTCKDPVEDMAVKAMQQAAAKVLSDAGDGTTTVLVLAQAIYNEGYKLIEMGIASPIEIKRSLETLLPELLKQIKDKAISINGNKELLKQVATISANNDLSIGELIADAFELVGENGVVHAEKSKGISTYLDITDGAKFDRGYVSPYFINNTAKLSCELENPFILFYDKKIRAAQDIVPIMQLAAKQTRPLLVIAEEIEAQALSLLIVNKMQANFQVAAVKAPAFGDRRNKVLEDLAILTGGTLITESAGKTLQQVTIQDLGQADKVIITKSDTTIIQRKVDQVKISKRIDQIQEESRQTESEYEIQKNLDRIAMLAGKVAIINIGAPTEIELKEKKDRIDDALQATQAALKAGIVPGGGKIYFDLAIQYREESIANTILTKALTSPLRTICANTEVIPELIMSYLVEHNNLGFNALTGEYEDLFKAGIIDPALVLISALQNAISIATTLLLTEATITEEPVENSQMQAPMMDEGMY